MALVDTTPRSPVAQALQLVVIIVAMMWLIEALDSLFLDGRLDQQGIEPRTIGGLDGVLWAPLLHGGFGHLVANTLPFLVHVGASGLVFGYAGFLLVAGFAEKSIKGIAVAVVVGVLFGGMILRGIAPVSSYVSWESHLFGLAAGVLAAFALADPDDERLQQV